MIAFIKESVKAPECLDYTHFAKSVHKQIIPCREFHSPPIYSCKRNLVLRHLGILMLSSRRLWPGGILGGIGAAEASRLAGAGDAGYLAYLEYLRAESPREALRVKSAERRPLYYAAENARRRALAEEMRPKPQLSVKTK